MEKIYNSNLLACILLLMMGHANVFALGDPLRGVIPNDRESTRAHDATVTPQVPVAPGLQINYIRETDISLTIQNSNEGWGIIELYRSRTIDGEYVMIYEAHPSEYSILDEGPKNIRTMYYYKCRFVGEEESPFSEPLEVTTLSINYWPTVTTALINNNTAVEITLTDNSANDRQYIIEEISAYAFTARVNMPDSGRTVTVIHEPVTPGHRYSYIVSVMSHDWRPYDYYEGVTLNEVTVPALPETPELYDLRIEENDITVEFINNNGGGVTEIYRSRSPDSGYELIASVPANEYLYLDADLNVRTTYYYKLRAAEDGAYSEFSSPSETTTFSINYWPTLTAEVVDGDRIELTFTDNSANDKSYEINDGVHNFHELFSMTDSGRTVTFQIQPIVPGDTYTFEVIMTTNGYPDEGFFYDENFAEVTVPDQAACEGTGKIRQEFWTNVPGTDLSTVPFDSPPNNFKDYNNFETQQYYANSYGSRMRARVCVPLTGDYTFWISSDDMSQLYLSTDEQPGNKQLIASVTGHTRFQQYDKYSTQESQPIHLEAGRSYYIEALHKEGNGNDFISVGWRLPDGQLERPIPGNRLIFIEGATLNPCEGTGTIIREIWTGIPGTSISSVPFDSPPDFTTSLTMFGTPNYTANEYGSRIRGYLCVPESGAYTFYIASDDNSELWLSTSEDPADKVLIASLNGHVKPSVYTKYSSQISTPVNLVGGHKYYIEALHKEGGGADHLSVAWRYPNGDFEGPIPGSRLTPFGEDVNSARMASKGNIAAPVASDYEFAAGINIYPNPTLNREVTIEIPGLSPSDEAVIQVVSPNGKVVFEERLVGQENLSSIPIRMGEHTNAGIYFVNVITGRKRWSGKLLVD